MGAIWFLFLNDSKTSYILTLLVFLFWRQLGANFLRWLKGKILQKYNHSLINTWIHLPTILLYYCFEYYIGIVEWIGFRDTKIKLCELKVWSLYFVKNDVGGADRMTSSRNKIITSFFSYIYVYIPYTWKKWLVIFYLERLVLLFRDLEIFEHLI